MEFQADYIIGFLVVFLAFLFLFKKIKKSIQKGKCASCPVYEECEKGHKVDITDIK
jgi:hypothetical protein